MPARQLLVDKYRPQSFEDLVLPARHGLAKVVEWFGDPYPSAWLFYGPSGIGKTSLARIMASVASPSEYGRQTFVGPDLDSNTVRQLAPTLTQRPVFGGMHSLLINEADAIPQVGQIRMLDLLEANAKLTATIVCTANSDLEKYESRLTSRFQCIRFSKEGLLFPATQWLLKIAEREEIKITAKAAERLVVESKSNLREALQRLDAHAARTRVPGTLPIMGFAGGLPGTGPELSRNPPN